MAPLSTRHAVTLLRTLTIPNYIHTYMANGFKPLFVLHIFIVLVLSDNEETPVEQTQQIHIGGLFENIEDIKARSFLAAVRYVNQHKLISKTELVAHVRQVSQHDSFQVEKTLCELLEKGVVGVLGPGSPLTSYHVQSLCDTLEVPRLTTRWDMTQRRSSCHLNLYPHPTALSHAISEIVRAWKWKGFTVLYDDYDALMKIENLMKMSDDKGILVAIRQLTEEPDSGYRSILQEIKYSEERNIVLECSVDILYDVLIQAQQVDLMGQDYSYLITTLDFHTIDYTPFKWGGTNITTLRLLNPEDPYVQEVTGLWAADPSLLDDWNDSTQTSEVDLEGKNDEGDLKADFPDPKGNDNYGDDYDDTETSGTSTPSSSEVPTTATSPVNITVPNLESALIHDAVHLFAKALNYIGRISVKPISCWEGTGFSYGYSLINYMRLSELEGVSGLVKFDHEGFRTGIQLDLMELTKKGLKKRGTWNGTLTWVHPEPVGPYINDGEDLRNVTFTVLIALTKPYIMLKLSKETLKGNDRYEGFGIDLIHELSLMSGFNYIFKEHHDTNSGSPTYHPNGTTTWDGMIGEVIAERVDLAVADISITKDRVRDVDFTHPFMDLGIGILHRKPKKAPPSLFSFLSPFSYEVWAYMMSAYVGVSILLFVMARISPYEWTNPYPCIEEPEALENQFSLINSFWFTVGSLMQQGSDVAPISASTRLIASIWWFFTLIMVSSYTAQLASFLTIENPLQPFKNVKELAEQDVIKYGAKANGSTATFFKDSHDPIYKKIHNFMVNNPEYMMGPNEGVKKVESETNYAYFMESTGILYEVERRCDLASVGGLLDTKGYGIAMKQNSSYRNVLSKHIVQLQEKGKLQLLKDKWWKEKRGGGACSVKADVGQASAMSLSNTGGVFVVLLGGCIFSIFIAFCEILWDVYQNSNKASFKQALMEELKFALKCSVNVKPVRVLSPPICIGAKREEVAESRSSIS